MSFWLGCVYCTYVHCIQTIIIWEFSLHTMWGLCKCKYSIHLFNSVHICALWFCEALAGEMPIFLTFLALELGHRTVESWSVSCVSTAFTYVWIKGHLRFWFVLFLSLSLWLPLLGVWLKWLCKCWFESLCQPFLFCLCLLGCLVFGLGWHLLQ